MSVQSVELQIGQPQAVLTSVGNTAITTMYLCNKSPNTITANIFLVPATNGKFGGNIIYSNLSIAGNDTYVLEHERLLLGNGDSVSANIGADVAFNSLVVATVSYTSI
jgi:hypothetical protein